MKSVIDGFFTALSLYSVIPVPVREWNKENTRYTLCFFPVVGGAIGAMLLLWFELCLRFSVSAGLFAAAAALLPEFVSGGIHLDGFMDTADALSAHTVTGRRLEILADPHLGAFGVIFCGGLLLLRFGLWLQIYETPHLLILPALGYILSRALCGLSIATFPYARDTGLVCLFRGAAAERATRTVCILTALAAVAPVLRWYPLWGVIAGLTALCYYRYHRRFCIWEFGGNTGDLAGFFLETLELLLLLIAAIGGLAR